MYRAFIALGSNINSPKKQLKKAIELLKEKSIIIIQESSIYETQAWGIVNQENFLNQVIEIKTTLLPFQLLKTLISIEEEMGRERINKWGPRNIDLDVLFFEDWVIKSKDLSIPHPKISERKFVLAPLNEIAQNFIHPLKKEPISNLLSSTQDQSWIKPYKA